MKPNVQDFSVSSTFSFQCLIILVTDSGLFVDASSIFYYEKMK